MRGRGHLGDPVCLGLLSAPKNHTTTSYTTSVDLTSSGLAFSLPGGSRVTRIGWKLMLPKMIRPSWPDGTVATKGRHRLVTSNGPAPQAEARD
jgi:hypothetical protein